MDYTLSQSLATRTAQFLAQHPPYSFLGEDILKKLAASMTIQYFAAHQFIFQEGEPARHMIYILQKGQVELMQEVEGETRLIDVCDVGDSFGVRSSLTERNYIASAKASTDTLVYGVPSEIFRVFLSEYPRVAMFFASGFAAGMTIVREQGVKVEKGRKLLQTKSKETTLFREEDVIISKPQAKVLFCLPHNTIKEAAQIMADYRVGSLVVANEQLHPVGILTNVDITRKIGTGLHKIQEPVTHIMSRPVIAIPQGETIAEVILMMMRHNIRHLVVTEDGTPDSQFVGLISEHDVLLSQGNNPAVLVKRIMHATKVEELAEIRDRAEELIFSYLEQEVSIPFVTATMTGINDALIERAIEMSLKRLDEEGWNRPRQPFCWMSLGSEGRGEQLLRTDQDNALVYVDPPEEEAETVAFYYQKLGTYTTDILLACGFAECPGGIMASNPKWNQPLSGWKKHFSHWIRKPEPQALMHASIFFDFRGSYGDLELIDELNAHLWQEMNQEPGFINFLAQNALDSPPPLSFFKNFIVERGGDHKDEFDIKARGMMPLTQAARVWTLAHKVPNITHTVDRFEKLAELEPQNAQVYKEAAMAYELMIRYRALNGFRNRNSGRFIHPETLNKIERQTLKYAFRTIEALQSALRTRFNLAFFRN